MVVYLYSERTNNNEDEMKSAKISNNAENQYLVIFGRVENSGEFIVSYAKPSKCYKTLKAAEKAKKEYENS